MPHQRLTRLAGVLVAVLLVLGLMPVASAHASTDPYPAPSRPTAVSVSRNAIALAWDGVPGAPRYQIAYSTSSTMKGAKLVTTTEPYVELTRLKANKTYHLTVRVVSSDGVQALSPASARLKVKTTSKSAAHTYLAPSGLAATPQTDRLSLSWTSRGNGLRYRVSVATNSSFTGAEHHEVKGTSATVNGLLDGTTYYVRVRVVSSKGKMRSAESPAVKVRTTPYPVTGDSTTVVVASYNVGAKSITTGGSWEARRAAVVETVLGQRPDVIGLQEASQGKLSGQNLTQAEDLVNRLGPPYTLANSARYNCKNPTTPHKCVAKYQGAANSQKIAYNSEKLTLLQQGSKKTSSAKTRMEEHRYVEWAIFRDKQTGRKFFFVNVHLDPGSTKAARAMRRKQVGQILDLIKAKNPAGLPSYVVGDFNSHKWSEPTNEAYDQMVKAGYVDPLGNTYKSTTDAPRAIVRQRINTEYSSHNNWERVARVKPGWVNGIYLDYIWTSAGTEVPEWETVVRVDQAGRFVGRIPSDHNMLRATTVLR